MIEGLQELNNQFNDVAVLRLEIKALEDEKQAILDAHERLQEIDAEIQRKKHEKDTLQAGLLVTMQSNGLKSYKTDYASFSRATRYSVEIDPAYKKSLEKRLKEGEEIPNVSLKANEYISIRSV